MKQGNSGFTLIEVMISVVSLLVFFGAIVAIFQIVTNMIGESRLRTVATALAEERMEVARNLPYVDLGTVGGIPAGSLPQEEMMNINGQDFTVGYTIVYIDDDFDGNAPADLVSTDYKRVRVDVTWGGSFPSRGPVVLVSDAAPDGLETTEGGGILLISVINAVGEAVGDAQVSIANTSVVPEVDLDISSDDDGRVLLPGAPACVDCYEITVTKSGYSSDRTYSTSEVTNPLKPHSTVIEGDITALTFSIDRLSKVDTYVTGSQTAGYPPFQGVEFTLRGSKQIGTNALDEPIYKFEQNFVSGFGGRIYISNLEWDTYEISLPDVSSVDLAGSYPVSPFSLAPAQNLTLRMVTSANTANSLLAIVETISEVPVATASVTLIGPGSYIATKSAGLSGKGDWGQAFFSGLSGGSYGIVVSHPDYLEATGSATISEDVTQVIVVEGE